MNLFQLVHFLQLNQTCRRELKEETGLDIPESSLTTTKLGLWEVSPDIAFCKQCSQMTQGLILHFPQSVYPPVISMGLPQRHHIVVYILAQVHEDHQTLQEKLSLQQEEVDAAAWLDQHVASEVASSDDYGQSRKVPQRYFRLGA